MTDGGGIAGGDAALFDPLVVEITKPDDLADSAVAPWLGSSIRIRTPVNGLPVATLTAQLYRGRTVNTGSELAPRPRPLDEVLRDDTRVTVRTARPSPDMDQVLFEGFVQRIETQADGRQRTAQIECVHVADVLTHDLERTLHGQAWLNIRQRAELAQGLPVNPVVVEALECVFNPRGAPNCYRFLAPLPVPGGGTLRVPTFTHPRDPDAVPWTWARVYAYLLWWARRVEVDPQRPDASPFLRDWTAHNFVDRNLYSILSAGEAGQTLLDLSPRDDAVTTPWGKLLLAAPRSHALDGQHWLRAADWCNARSGLRYTWESFKEGGDTRTGVRWSVPRGYGDVAIGPPATRGSDLTRCLLASPNYRVDNVPWTTVRENNNTTVEQASIDFDSCVNTAEVRGGADVYEITIELAPGWAANSDWDVDPSNAAAVELAQGLVDTPYWSERYNREGRQLQNPQYASVGRLWGLNTFGAWTNYGRAFAPFDEDAYALVDFRAQLLGELFRHESGDPALDDPDNYRPAWITPRPRPIGPCLSGYTLDNGLPPYAEISFDAGATWEMLNGDVRVSERDARIFIEKDDLRQVVSRFSPLLNYPKSYIAGLVRLRITGTVAGDRCWREGPARSTVSRSRRPRAALHVRRDDLQRKLRDPIDAAQLSGGNSQFKNTAFPARQWTLAEGRKEQRALYAFVEQADRVRNRGTFELPELVFKRRVGAIVSGYAPGDELEGVFAEGSQRDHDLRLAARSSAEEEFSTIAAVEWHYDRGDGVQRGPAAVTRIHTESVFGPVQYGGR